MTEHVICDRCDDPTPTRELCRCLWCDWDGLCMLCVAPEDHDCGWAHGKDKAAS